MRRKRFVGVTAGSLLVAVGVALLAAAPAGAEVNGGCKASLAGVNLAHTPPNGGPAVTVSQNAVVPFSMTGVNGEKFSELHIYYTIGGFDIDIYDASAGGGSWSHNVDIHSFARFGVGYYRLKGVGDFAGGGGGGCDGEALIKVTGDPLGTVAGDVATGATVAGVLGMLGAGLGAGGGDGGGGGSDPPVTQDDVAKESERQRDLDNLEHGASQATGGWCSIFGVLLLLVLPLVLLFGTGAVAMAAIVPVVKVRRRRWPFVLGAFSGLLTGLGVGVLLQQYAIVYPTRTWAIVYVAGGILLGLAVPALRRSLSR
jgi:hypothetical protein